MRIGTTPQGVPWEIPPEGRLWVEAPGAREAASLVRGLVRQLLARGRLAVVDLEGSLLRAVKPWLVEHLLGLAEEQRPSFYRRVVVWDPQRPRRVVTLNPLYARGAASAQRRAEALSWALEGIWTTPEERRHLAACLEVLTRRGLTLLELPLLLGDRDLRRRLAPPEMDPARHRELERGHEEMCRRAESWLAGPFRLALADPRGSFSLRGDKVLLASLGEAGPGGALLGSVVLAWLGLEGEGWAVVVQGADRLPPGTVGRLLERGGRPLVLATVSRPAPALRSLLAEGADRHCLLEEGGGMRLRGPEGEVRLVPERLPEPWRERGYGSEEAYRSFIDYAYDFGSLYLRERPALDRAAERRQRELSA